MNYQDLIIVGNATKDAQPRQSKDGEKTFTTFDVGVSDGQVRHQRPPCPGRGPRAGQRQGLLQRRGRLVAIWSGGDGCQRREADGVKNKNRQEPAHPEDAFSAMKTMRSGHRSFR